MTIQDEEILGLLGPNGAGKTTLMLMMGTVYRPTSGKISVNGLDGRSASERCEKDDRNRFPGSSSRWNTGSFRCPQLALEDDDEPRQGGARGSRGEGFAGCRSLGCEEQEDLVDERRNAEEG